MHFLSRKHLAAKPRGNIRRVLVERKKALSGLVGSERERESERRRERSFDGSVTVVGRFSERRRRKVSDICMPFVAFCATGTRKRAREQKEGYVLATDCPAGAALLALEYETGAFKGPAPFRVWISA